ncbi:HipA domain-containing protein, partial [Daejeonella sp.]|uniref:HipA domain-containing protein n=1 Tax=Daejeonella sp. TaxID=2805397 RepID=UPI00398312DC
IEKYFVMVLFNYLFSNGDAHLKNFALLESGSGDYLLSPAYDLINTRLHIDDTDFALTDLFADKLQSGAWKNKGHASAEDFREFGRRIGVQPKRIDKLLVPFLVKQEQVETLISRSFLNEPAKRGYLMQYQTKRNYLNG